MVLSRTDALVELCHVFDHVAAVASVALLGVGLESFEELLVPWAGHALATDVKITRLPACEEVLLICIDLTVAHIAVKLAAVSLKRPAFHSTDLWIDEVAL